MCDQAREGENKLAEELKKLRKENYGLVNESTSPKKGANILRDEGEKEGEEASRSRRERKISRGLPWGKVPKTK